MPGFVKTHLIIDSVDIRDIRGMNGTKLKYFLRIRSTSKAIDGIVIRRVERMHGTIEELSILVLKYTHKEIGLGVGATKSSSHRFSPSASSRFIIWLFSYNF